MARLVAGLCMHLPAAATARLTSGHVPRHPSLLPAGRAGLRVRHTGRFDGSWSGSWSVRRIIGSGSRSGLSFFDFPNRSDRLDPLDRLDR